jgi:type IV pilus biogenesis protein CpaD/CtpE
MQMRFVSSILAAAVLFLFAGCTSFDPNTGEKVFDEAKTAALLAPMEGPIAVAVKIASENDINTGTGLRIAEQVISNLLASEGSISRDTISARIAEIPIDGLDSDDANLARAIAIETVLNYYDILVAYVVRAEIPKAPALKLVLETIRDGINLGLTQATPGG